MQNFDNIETMGRRFKRFRILFDLSPEALADTLDLSVELISEIETGKREPGVSVLVDMAKAYGLDLNWLLTGHSDLIRWEGYKGGLPPVEVKVFLESKGIPYKEKEHEELLRLLQVPEVFVLMSARLLEVGILFRPQIREKLIKKGENG